MQRRPFRKWPWVVAGTLMTLVLIVLLIPAALSSRRFTSWLGARISRSTGGQTDIGSLSVGWLRGVEVSDFRFRGPDGWAQVKIDRITTQPNYASLFGAAPGLDRTVIEKPQIEIDLGDNPMNFSGAIGLDGILDMKILLPYTYEGRTARIGDEGRSGKRISVPLTGTLNAPQINLQKWLETQLQEQIFGGIDELLKRLKK
ncbi:MAG TPA: hypothetical protein VLI39_21000 [Sedimentisphaerales bacterium]|nr:hypothetical protein [Sedimentisphaerales bacterium]